MERESHILDRLAAVIADKATADPGESYTAALVQGASDRVLRKVGEEALEVILAADNPDELRAESADLLYHLLVLWQARGISPEDVWQELARREGLSGHAEKAARNQ